MASGWHAIAETYFVPAQLACAMLGMGATLRVRDFIDVVRDPIGLGIGLGLQLIFVPLMALGFSVIFDLSAGWSVGLLLVSVVPGGALSNLLTFLGRGNTPLSISLTLAATVSCIFTVPVILGLLAGSSLPADFVFPTAQIVRDIFLFLVLPLGVGMWLFYLNDQRALKISRWAIKGALALIVLITLSSLQSGRIKVAEYGWLPPLIIVLFATSLAIVIPHLCRLMGRYDDDTVAIGVEVTVRNVGVGLLMIQFFFPNEPAQGHVLYSCLFYAGISMIFAVPQALLHRVGRSPVLFRARKPKPESKRADVV